jgi:hypothetical protein
VSAAVHADAQDLFAANVTAYLEVGARSAQAIANVTTEVASVGSGEALLPVTVNGLEEGNTWICSPYCTYAVYAAEEVRRLGHPFISGPLEALCGVLGRYLRNAGIDNVVAVNNWLISTNLYPPARAYDVPGIIAEANARWPGHAVWFRSLNARYTADWLESLIQAGCMLIPSRQVYLYDAVDANATRPVDLQRDFRLLRTTSLSKSPADQWTSDDFERASKLYALLYLEKYSRLNPAYTGEFLRLWHQAGLIDLVGFRDTLGELRGVVGMYSDGATITSPIVGYDTSRPQEEGLYRILAATVLMSAARSGRRVNLSAGVGEFKRLRGGAGEIEYSAVYARHLPPRSRRALGRLSFVTRRLGVPIMRYFRL